jgi:tRNA(Ile)-lysidine synthetase-like protein
MNLNLHIKPGTYIVAVSGGVDSVVLLDTLMQQTASGQKLGIDIKYQLIVAHFDHGILKNSAQVAKFVKGLAKKHNLKFELDKGNLGPNTTEEIARRARYEFLLNAQKKHTAEAIITAHHLDDKIETAVFQVLRGSGRYGLDPFSRTSDIMRPLQNVPKSKILQYAKANKLQWFEDASNQNIKIKRNYIRHRLIPSIEKSDPTFKKYMSKTIQRFAVANKSIDAKLGKLLKQAVLKQTKNEVHLSRKLLKELPVAVREAFLHYVIAKYFPLGSLNTAQVQRLAEFSIKPETGKQFPFAKSLQVKLSKTALVIQKLSEE